MSLGQQNLVISPVFNYKSMCINLELRKPFSYVRNKIQEDKKNSNLTT